MLWTLLGIEKVEKVSVFKTLFSRLSMHLVVAGLRGYRPKRFAMEGRPDLGGRKPRGEALGYIKNELSTE